MNWERELETESPLDIYLSESFWTFLYNSVSSSPHTCNGAIQQPSSEGPPGGDRQNHWQMKRSQLAARQRAGLWPLHFCIEGPFLFQSHIQQGQSSHPQSLLPISLCFFPISQATDLSCHIRPRLDLCPEKKLQIKSAPHFRHSQWGPGISCVSITWEQIQTPGSHPDLLTLNRLYHKALNESYACSSLQNAVLSTAIGPANSASHLTPLDETPSFPASTALSTGLGHNHLHLPCC